MTAFRFEDVPHFRCPICRLRQNAEHVERGEVVSCPDCGWHLIVTATWNSGFCGAQLDLEKYPGEYVALDNSGVVIAHGDQEQVQATVTPLGRTCLATVYSPPREPDQRPKTVWERLKDR